MKQVHNSAERGAALVELAIALPMLVTILLVAVDLGVVLREHQILQNAAREGARFSALPQNWISPVNPTANTDAIQQRVVDYLSQENITVAKGNVKVNQQYQIKAGGLTVDASQITVTYTRSLVIAGGAYLPFAQVTLTGQSVFRNLY
jgi:Flp pilus assembly protein TadG